MTSGGMEQMLAKNNSSKNGRFVYPLLAIWLGLSILLFCRILIDSTVEDQSRSLMLGGCMSFCYFWGIYHWAIVFQRVMNPKTAVWTEPTSDLTWPRVAILYCICDNLDRDAILSANQQNYPEFDVLLLDDSFTTECQLEVDQLANECGFLVLRRADRSGYKAGNLNNALAKLNGRYAFVAINDADELLTPNFLRSCVSVLAANPHLAFVQANHCNHAGAKDTGFAKRFGVMTDVRWAFYREYANRAGTCFSLGHGLMLRTAAWRAVGGYPTVVSEDIAMTLRLLAAGWRGVFLCDVMCRERFSEAYSRFRQRFARCVEADVECIQAEMASFLGSSKPQFVEKFDAVIRECRYPAKSLFLPLAAALSVLVAGGGMPSFLSHPSWVACHVCLLLGPWAPYFVSLQPRKSFSFFGSSVWAFSSSAIVMLSAGVRVFFRKPTFVVTFRKNERPERHTGILCDAICGLLAVAYSIQLSSASLLVIGTALITSPLLSKEFWWRSNVLSTYLPILVVVCGISLSGIPAAAVVLLPIVLLLY